MSYNQHPYYDPSQEQYPPHSSNPSSNAYPPPGLYGGSSYPQQTAGDVQYPYAQNYTTCSPPPDRANPQGFDQYNYNYQYDQYNQYNQYGQSPPSGYTGSTGGYQSPPATYGSPGYHHSPPPAAHMQQSGAFSYSTRQVHPRTEMAPTDARTRYNFDADRHRLDVMLGLSSNTGTSHQTGTVSQGDTGEFQPTGLARSHTEPTFNSDNHYQAQADTQAEDSFDFEKDKHFPTLKKAATMAASSRSSTANTRGGGRGGGGRPQFKRFSLNE